MPNLSFLNPNTAGAAVTFKNDAPTPWEIMQAKRQEDTIREKNQQDQTNKRQIARQRAIDDYENDFIGIAQVQNDVVLKSVRDWTDTATEIQTKAWQEGRDLTVDEQLKINDAKAQVAKVEKGFETSNAMVQPLFKDLRETNSTSNLIYGGGDGLMTDIYTHLENNGGMITASQLEELQKQHLSAEGVFSMFSEGEKYKLKTQEYRAIGGGSYELDKLSLASNLPFYMVNGVPQLTPEGTYRLKPTAEMVNNFATSSVGKMYLDKVLNSDDPLIQEKYTNIDGSKMSRAEASEEFLVSQGKVRELEDSETVKLGRNDNKLVNLPSAYINELKEFEEVETVINELNKLPREGDSATVISLLENTSGLTNVSTEDNKITFTRTNDFNAKGLKMELALNEPTTFDLNTKEGYYNYMQLMGELMIRNKTVKKASPATLLKVLNWSIENPGKSYVDFKKQDYARQGYKVVGTADPNASDTGTGFQNTGGI